MRRCPFNDPPFSFSLSALPFLSFDHTFSTNEQSLFAQRACSFHLTGATSAVPPHARCRYVPSEDSLPYYTMASSLQSLPLKTPAEGKLKKALTEPVSVSVCVVWASASHRTANFRESKGSRLSGTLRFDSQREEILIASSCLIPLQKRVSWNKDKSISTQKN